MIPGRADGRRCCYSIACNASDPLEYKSPQQYLVVRKWGFICGSTSTALSYLQQAVLNDCGGAWQRPSTPFDRILVPNRKLLGRPSQSVDLKQAWTDQPDGQTFNHCTLVAMLSRPFSLLCTCTIIISFPRKQPRETPPAMTTTMDGWQRSNLCTTTGSIRAKCCRMHWKL